MSANPVTAVVATFANSVAAVRQFVVQFRLGDKNAVSAALAQILAAHGAIPMWLLKEEDKPVEALTVEPHFKLVDEQGSGGRLPALCKVLEAMLQRTHELLQIVATGLLQGEDQPWAAGLPAAFLEAQQCASESPIVIVKAWESPILKRIQMAFRGAYLAKGGSDGYADELSGRAAWFIEDGLLGYSWVIARIAHALESASLLLPALRPRLEEAERSAGVLVNHLEQLTKLP